MTKEITIYTVQDTSIISVLNKGGTIYPDVKKADKDYKDAYAWLYSKMKERGYPLGLKDGGMFWGHPAKRDTKTYSGLLIELRLPIEHVMPSEYMDWHTVLNKGALCNIPYIHDDDESLKAWDKEYDRLSLAENHEEKIKSWDICLDAVYKNGKIKPGKTLKKINGKPYKPVWQVTFTSFRCVDIVSTKIVTYEDLRLSA